MNQGKMNLKFDPQTKISVQRYTRNDHTALMVQVVQILLCKIQFLTDSPFSCLINLLLPTESNNINSQLELRVRMEY